jgi:hypothetical protein
MPQLSGLGMHDLPESAVTDPVIVTDPDTEVVMEGHLFTGPVGADIDLGEVVSSGSFFIKTPILTHQ